MSVYRYRERDGRQPNRSFSLSVLPSDHFRAANCHGSTDFGDSSSFFALYLLLVLLLLLLVLLLPIRMYTSLYCASPSRLDFDLSCYLSVSLSLSGWICVRLYISPPAWGEASSRGLGRNPRDEQRCWSRLSHFSMVRQEQLFPKEERREEHVFHPSSFVLLVGRLWCWCFSTQLRLEGTNKEAANEVLREVQSDPQFSRLQLLQEDDFDKAAQLAVKVSSVVDAASRANLKVQILPPPPSSL